MPSTPHALAARLREAGLRAGVDDSHEKMARRSALSQLMKIPYTLVVGDKEIEAGTVSVRDRHGERDPRRSAGGVRRARGDGGPGPGPARGLMERLWTPWRMGYIKGADSAEGCFLCDAPELDPEQDDRTYILHRGSDAFVILNIYPYNTGHMMVAPYRHAADLESLERRGGTGGVRAAPPRRSRR